MILKSQQIESYILDAIQNATPKQRLGLTSEQAWYINRPAKFINKTSLDQKLAVLNKLGRKMIVVMIDDEKGMTPKEFSLLFRHTFLDIEKNELIAEMAHEKAIFVYGNEGVQRYLHKLELFLESDLMEVMRFVKRIGGKGIQEYKKENEPFELKELFIHIVLRMFISEKKMDEYFISIALSWKEFVFMAILYISAKPMTAQSLAKKFLSLAGIKHNGKVFVRKLHEKGYVNKVENNTSHNSKEKIHTAWVLSDQGHDAIVQIIRKVQFETMERKYE